MFENICVEGGHYGENSHKKKDKEDIGNVKLLDLSEDRLIDIQEEAYYRALKRIEEEKQKANIVTFETKEKKVIRGGSLL